MALTRLCLRFRAAPVAALALFMGACGLGSQEPSGVSIPYDGVSGFGEVAPVELCLGSARVVPPSAGGAGAGVCVREGASGAPCGSDAACSGIERCVCGRCIVEACQGAASCDGGRVCRGRRCTTSCASDAACAPGERCVSGGCARACASDEACHFGERCDPLDDVCTVKLCGGALLCGAGAVCEHSVAGGELREPALVSVSGETLAFVEIRGLNTSAGSAIYRARVDAPGRWVADPELPVLEPLDGEAEVGAPSVIGRGDAVELFFAAGGGARIGRAVSLDRGRTFASDPAPVLEPSEAWERGYVGSPSVVEHLGTIYLAYEGGPRAGIGIARVGPGGAERLAREPVVTPALVEDPLLWRVITEVGAPHALAVNGAVRLYFTARGAEGGDAWVGGDAVPADRNDSIGLVTTRDMAVFEPYPAGPVFARVTNLRAYLGEREAFVRVLPSGAEITFVASDASGSAVSGLARAASP